MAAAAEQKCNCVGNQCTDEQCNCCPWCCDSCKGSQCKSKKKCDTKTHKCGLEPKHKPCTEPLCGCRCCISKRESASANVFWCIIGALIFAIFLAFAYIIYKTKSKAYMIPKVVYEWTGYTSTYSGLGSKNLQ
ncbi:hypothetical protein BBBOND_0108480 [Babesia bigemina]|uniref:Uncharacterized protein n=1 Tax=Babesia bigemina TaxID=5866 RepID=A0A061D9X9_BABBI|nr:hypothetical protein BBBOND_0108480 [Babesia bigemina]CDR94550.1 hypothetical protein BBBOND_0108480 [Babesia bigemina]|eukprot:XP_012766736.1 hypothetical protein BBBOND_0108480 [Babesia bigemina]